MYANGAAGEIAERRIALRQFVDLPPILVEGSAVTEQVRIVNLTRNGLLAHTRLAYRKGESVTVHFSRTHAVAAQIIWWCRGMFGAEFAAPIENELRDIGEWADVLDQPDLISPTAASRSKR
jgi:hypothetical protein